jgi:hypothetical protein
MQADANRHVARLSGRMLLDEGLHLAPGEQRRIRIGE